MEYYGQTSNDNATAWIQFDTGDASFNSILGKVEVTNTAIPSTGTAYYFPYITGNATGTYGLLSSNRLYLYDSANTTYFCIGATDRTGGLTIRNANGHYADIVTSAFSANRTLTLPNATGWFAVGNTAGVGSDIAPVYLNSNGVLTATDGKFARLNGSNQLIGFSTTMGASPHSTVTDYADHRITFVTCTDGIFLYDNTASTTLWSWRKNSNDIWQGSITGNAATTTALKNQGRATNANITHVTDGGMRLYLATSSMTSNKPATDGYILHFHWDTSSAWDSQIFISDNNNSMQYRGSTAAGTWGAWKTIIDTSNWYKLIFANKNISRSTLSVYDSTWTVTSGTDVFGLSFKDTGLTYTPSGGSATASSDTGDWRAWLTCDATANNVTLNMRIDGSFQANNLISSSTATFGGDLLFNNSGTTTRQIRGVVGDNDYWRIAGGATAANAGWMEIATADDGNEPIYVRQYTGAYTTITRTATLLDSSGDTSFPGQVSCVGRSTTDTTAANYYHTGGIQIYESNLVGNTQDNFAYAPRIGFHWRNRIAATLSFHKDGIFYFRSQNGTSRATVDANVIGALTGNVTGNCSGSSGSCTGNAATATRLATFNLTGGNGNTGGFRLAYTWNIAAWSNHRMSFIVQSRHSGGGLVTISVGNNTSTVNRTNMYAEIKYWGPTNSGDIIAAARWQIYGSADGTKAYLFWNYGDYNTGTIVPLTDTAPSNGTWMETIDSSYGTLLASTEINVATSAVYLKDRTNSTASYLNYGAAGLAASAITWLCCWNGYEVRAISKAEMRNAVSSPYMVTESYPALMPTNATNNWIKIGTTNDYYGLLPSQGGNAGNGHNYLGTSSWYWKYAYIDEIYGHLNGNCTGSSGSCTGNAATATRINGNLSAASSNVNRNIWISDDASASGIPRYASNFYFNPSTSVLCLPAGGRITKASGNLYIGDSGNSGWVLTQDICSHTGSGDTYWSARVNGTGHFKSVYGAVWNDYAEMRNVPEAQLNINRICDEKGEVERDYPCAGRCVSEIGNGEMKLTDKRMQKGCKIISDTFGFCIGENEECKTPIAVTGRVLAYPLESITECSEHIGDFVCSGPNGTISIMTSEEAIKYPESIVGTISEIPTYTIWHCGNKVTTPIQVNGRIWIYVR